MIWNIITFVLIIIATSRVALGEHSSSSSSCVSPYASWTTTSSPSSSSLIGTKKRMNAFVPTTSFSPSTSSLSSFTTTCSTTTTTTTNSILMMQPNIKLPTTTPTQSSSNSWMSMNTLKQRQQFRCSLKMSSVEEDGDYIRNNDYYNNRFDYQDKDDEEYYYQPKKAQKRQRKQQQQQQQRKFRNDISPQKNVPIQKEKESSKENTYYRIDIEVLSASNLLTNKDVFDTSDPYCKIKIGSVSDQTQVVFNIKEEGKNKKKNEVVWNERMDFYLPKKEKDDDDAAAPPPPEKIVVQVWDWDANSKDELMGFCFVYLDQGKFFGEGNGMEEEFVEEQVELYHPEDGDLEKDCGSVRLRYRCRLWKEQEGEEEEEEEEEESGYEGDDEADFETKKQPEKIKAKNGYNTAEFAAEEEDYYDDYEDYEDDYYYESPSSPGNFWSNPKPGLDPYPSEQQQQQKRKKGGNLPPTTADPSEQQERRRRRPASPGRRRQSEEIYGVPPPASRSSFRSGVPPPPKPMKEFYDRFFWYGFDSEDTTSPADRTMFGGTRGKFNGLELLKDRDEGKWDVPRRKRVWDEERGRYVDYFEYQEEDRGRRGRRRQQQQQQERDMGYYDDEYELLDEDEEDMFGPRGDYNDDYNEEEWGLKSKKRRRVRPDAPTLPPARREEMDMFPSLSSSRRRDRIRKEYRNSYNEEEDDEYRRRLAEAFQRKMRSKRKESDWISGEVSTWFETQPAPQSDYSFDDDDDDYDDDDYLMERSRGDRRMRRAGSRRKSKGPLDLAGILDAVFDLDSDMVDAKAKEYDMRTGKRKKDGRRMRRDDMREERRRKGFAYRYVDDDGSPPVADYELVDAGEEMTVEEVSGPVVGDGGVEKLPSVNQESRQGSSSSTSKEGEVKQSAKMYSNQSRQPQQQQRRRPSRRRSWEERARDVDRVPPSGVTAWGPEGEVKGGIDARAQAALDAMEEIRDAKRILEKKEEKVIDAEEMVIVAKTDASLQKKRMEARREELGTAKLRENIRLINAGVDNAARALRRARAEVQSALNKVDELEDRHWALLSEFGEEEEFDLEQSVSSDVEKSMNSSKVDMSVTENSSLGGKENNDKTADATVGKSEAEKNDKQNGGDKDPKSTNDEYDDIIDLDKIDEQPKK